MMLSVSGETVLDRLAPSPLAVMSPEVRPALPAASRDHLGRELLAFYAARLSDELPKQLVDLVARLEARLPEEGSDAAFRKDLVAALPGLRAFALSLALNPSRADDLVQETLLKAWANQNHFAPGSNLMAWLCTILRNQFYTDCRKRKREVEDADGIAAGQMTVQPAQEHGIELKQVWSLLGKLPAVQREALLLVAAQGLTYEAAADLVGCQVGTVKSRVSRARAMLAGSLGIPARRVSA
jgi:RNA polymerase sigma-70 factor (ECF subfamily)